MPETPMHTLGAFSRWRDPSTLEKAVGVLRAGYSGDKQGLIFMRNSIKNFGIYLRRSQCTGWSDKPDADVCNWPGITCMDKQVVGLHFLNNGSVLVGKFSLVEEASFFLFPAPSSTNRVVIVPLNWACTKLVLQIERALSL